MRNFTSLGGVDWLQGRRLLPAVTRHAQSTRGVVLDFGCGDSPLRGLFKSASRYVRVDIVSTDPEVMVITDARQLPLESGTIDTILASRMLGDLPDLQGVLAELHRVLAPGGKLLVYEAISYPQHDLPHDYWRVLPEGLRWAAGRTGWKVVEVEYLGGYFTQIALHWNQYVMSGTERLAITRPLAWVGRALCNLACAGLDAVAPRPMLATDYFACLIKQAEEGAPAP